MMIMEVVRVSAARRRFAILLSPFAVNRASVKRRPCPAPKRFRMARKLSAGLINMSVAIPKPLLFGVQHGKGEVGLNARPVFRGNVKHRRFGVPTSVGLL